MPSSAAPIPDISALTLEEKIGQMVCFGWEGPDSYLRLNSQARESVREWKIGGMVVMGRNVNAPVPKGASPESIDAAGVRAMLDEMQSLADIPLLISTDQEGGRVARFGTRPFTRMPAAKVIGDRGDVELARLAARATARELATVGVNWDFAPVADTNSNPDNPVIGDRAFGATVEAVAPMVAAQVKGYAEGGVLACAKHFPGHGDTSLDSHFALPSLPFGLEQMEARELVPFRAAIDAGIPSIMTAHILFPALDTKYPATLSPAILTGLLRESMGFDGLIVTDSLGMAGVAEKWGSPRAAVLSAIAGADVLLMCHVREQQLAILEALHSAVQSGELSEERVTDSAARILAAKRLAFALPRPDISVVGAPEHEQVRAGLAGETVVPSAVSTLGE